MLRHYVGENSRAAVAGIDMVDVVAAVVTAGMSAVAGVVGFVDAAVAVVNGIGFEKVFLIAARPVCRAANVKVKACDKLISKRF